MKERISYLADKYCTVHTPMTFRLSTKPLSLVFILLLKLLIFLKEKNLKMNLNKVGDTLVLITELTSSLMYR